MPYAILKHGNAFKVVNSATGKVHAKHTSLSNAEAQVRLLRGVEHGMQPRGRPMEKTKPAKRERTSSGTPINRV